MSIVIKWVSPSLSILKSDLRLRHHSTVDPPSHGREPLHLTISEVDIERLLSERVRAKGVGPKCSREMRLISRNILHHPPPGLRGTFSCY